MGHRTYRLRRDPGTKEIDHGPDTIGFTAFDHFQRLESVETFVGSLEPFSDGVFFYYFAQSIAKPGKLGHSSRHRFGRSAAAFQVSERPYGDGKEPGKDQLT